MSLTTIHKTRAREEHIDCYDHLNNSTYSIYFAEAEREHLARIGLEKKLSCSSSSEYRFLRQVTAGEDIEIVTEVIEKEGVYFLHQDMLTNGNVAASLKRSRNLHESNISDFGNIDTILADIFERGRKDAQRANFLEDNRIISNGMMFVVSKARHELKDCYALKSSCSTVLVSGFQKHIKGPRVILGQVLYDQEPLPKNELAVSFSEHVFVRDNKPIIHPEDIFNLNIIHQRKTFSYRLS